MKLIIPALDDIQNFDNIHIGIMIQDLEQKIASQYFVYPVMSNKSTESFKGADGAVKILSHVVFGYYTKGRITDNKLVYQLFKHLWNDISKAWNPGSLVMWRRKAEVKEYNNKDSEWFGEGKAFPDDWYVKLTLRIGSFDIPKVKTKIEGEGLSYISI